MTQEREDLAYDAGGIAQDLFDGHPARFNFRQIENIVDERKEMLPVAANDPRIGEALLFGSLGIEEKFGKAVDRRQRRADFVADVGEKERFVSIGGFGSIACQF